MLPPSCYARGTCKLQLVRCTVHVAKGSDYVNGCEKHTYNYSYFQLINNIKVKVS